MVLSGKEIASKIGSEIIIDPYDENKINSNSYNLTLHNELLVYKNSPLDMKKKNETERILIPKDGIILMPGHFYLGRTIEYTETKGLIPMLEGRSSIGRLGLFIHVTAGIGDIGFCGFWTLEMVPVLPIKIYSNIEICQICYYIVKGNYDNYSSNKYQNNKGVQPSLLFKEFKGEKNCENR